MSVRTVNSFTEKVMAEYKTETLQEVESKIVEKEFGRNWIREVESSLGSVIARWYFFPVDSMGNLMDITEYAKRGNVRL